MAKKDVKNEKKTTAKTKAEADKKKTAPVEKSSPKSAEETTVKAKVKADKKEGKAEATPPSSRLIHQLIPFVLWIVAILIGSAIAIHNLFGRSMGLAGDGIGDLFCGLFGIGACFIPVFIIYIAASWHKLIDSARVGIKVIFSAVTLFFFSTLINTFWVNVADFNHFL